MTLNKKYFGILPAAGKASRMRPFRYPKELLPVNYEAVPMTDYLRPKLLIEYALEAFTLAGVNDLYVVIPEWKPEVMRYLENGRHFNHHIAYLYNSDALGLADALLSGYDWLADKYTCFAMPDTIFSPLTAFVDLIAKIESTNADLVLGVFPTEESMHFAPVEFDTYGRVINVWEKPANPLFDNAWGIAVWSPRFWEFLKERSFTFTADTSITEAFDAAAKNGLNVNCVYFETGSYRDIGRYNKINFPKS